MTLEPLALIVDDDPGVTTALQFRLESIGCRCVVAHTGAQGLAEYQRHEPDIVLTDGSMPVGDGPALVRSIRAHAQTPIVLLTGNASKYESDMRSDPNVKILQKPYDGDVLAALVLTLLGRAQDIDEDADDYEFARTPDGSGQEDSSHAQSNSSDR